MNSFKLLKLGEFLNPDNYVVAFFQIPKGVTLMDAAQMIIEETSIGGNVTDPLILNKFSPRICKIDNDNRLLCIAYPIELFESNNIHQLLGLVGGNAFGIPVLKGLVLKDIELPKKIWKEYSGSGNGIIGIRDYLDNKISPLLSTVIKPQIGLSPRDYAELCYKSWVGGCDIVLDSDSLTSQLSCPFEERVSFVSKSKENAEKVSGKKKLYFANISGSILDIDEKVKILNKYKINSVALDLLSVGFVELEYIRKKYPKLLIHAHRATRVGFTGIESPVTIKVARLIGADSLHIDPSLSSVKSINQKAAIVDGLMRKPLYEMTSIMPFISGGLFAGALPYILRLLGNDVILNVGGGIHTHKDGTLAGAIACKQAIEITMQGKSIKEEYKKYAELKTAVEEWGIYEYGDTFANQYFVSIFIKN